MKRKLLIVALLFAALAAGRNVTRQAVADKLAEQAATKTAADILPASTLAYAELAEPKQLLVTIWEHPLRDKIEQTEQYKQYVQSKDYRRMRIGVEMFELEAEMTWREAVEAVAGSGLYVAFDPATNGAALLAKAGDLKKMHQLRDRVLAFLEKNGNRLQSSEYRGVTVYTTPGGGFAIVGPWLIASNNGELGQTMIDNLVDAKPTNTLAADAQFKAAKKQAHAAHGPTAAGESNAKPSGWAFVRVDQIRDGGFLNDALQKHNDPGGELLLGGLQEIIREAPFATATVKLTDDRAKVTIAAPHDPAKVATRRSYFFAPQGEGSADKPLTPNGTAASVTLYRDLAGMFRAADELFSEEVAAGIAQGESNLSLFFGGRSLTNDVLAGLSPRMQLLVTKQTFDDVTPAIKLPSAALIMKVRELNDESQQTILQIKSAFNSLVGLGNVAGTQQGKPMMLLDIAKHNGADLLSASFVVDPKMTNKQAADIVYNASPALALVDEYVILSSSKQLARDLIDEVKGLSKKTTIAENTLVQLDGKLIAEMLKANRQHLVAQEMAKGKSPSEAGRDIDLLLDLVHTIEQAKLGLSFQDKTATIDLDVKLNVSQ